MPPLGDESLPNTLSAVNIVGSRNWVYRHDGIPITNDTCENIMGTVKLLQRPNDSASDSRRTG